MHIPYVEHLEVVYKILLYLKSTPGKGYSLGRMNNKAWKSILMQVGSDPS